MIVLKFALVVLVAAIAVGVPGFVGDGPQAQVARIVFFILAFVFVTSLIAAGLVRKGIL